MKVNYDCVRDVLKALELHMEMKDGGIVCETLLKIESYPELQGYSKDDVVYSLMQLSQENYINARFHYGSGNRLLGATIYDITADGHSLLKDISSDTIWNKTKERASKAVGEMSLSSLREIAAMLIKAAVMTFLS